MNQEEKYIVFDTIPDKINEDENARNRKERRHGIKTRYNDSGKSKWRKIK